MIRFELSKDVVALPRRLHRSRIPHLVFCSALVVAAIGLSARPIRSEEMKTTAAETGGVAIQIKPTQGVLIESESAPQGEIATDTQALGGRYTYRDGDYQPVFRADLPVLPAGTANADAIEYTIWVRARGISLQLKGTDKDGKQSELQWIYDRPTSWKWISFGRFTRAKLGASLLMIRAPRGDTSKTLDKNSGVDAVILATDKDFDPSRDLAMTALAPLRINVDWSRPLFKTGPLSFGLNAFAAFNPKQTGGDYNKQVAYTGIGFLRLHNWGMMGDSAKEDGGWIDTANKKWDREKIKRALNGLYPHNPVLLLNIPAWPEWMDADKDNFLDADQKDAYAAFCVDLVRIVNVDLKHRVAYWEITNERDGLYYGDFQKNNGYGGLKDPTKLDRLDELADIYNRCAVAMKKVDPTIQTGGPALARSDWTDFTRRFVRLTLPNLDFYSYHVYVSGDRNDSDDAIYDGAQGIGSATRAIVDILKEESPKRHIPAFLNEYNISWSWEVRDPRMTNNKGVVFDALSLIAALSNGADGTNAWNEKDGIYGKIAPDDTLRPGAHGFHLFNGYLRGQVVSSSSSDDKSVVTFAVVDVAKKQRSLLIVNRSDVHQRIPYANFWKNPFLSVRDGSSYQISDTSLTSVPYTVEKFTSKSGRVGVDFEISLKPHSITLLASGESATQK